MSKDPRQTEDDKKLHKALRVALLDGKHYDSVKEAREASEEKEATDVQS